MSSKFSWIVALMLVASLAACGGGGSDSSVANNGNTGGGGAATPAAGGTTNTSGGGATPAAGGTTNTSGGAATPVLNDMAACFQVTAGNSFVFNRTTSPSSYQVVSTSAPVVVAAPPGSPVGTPSTTIPGITVTSTLFYSASTVTSTYRLGTFEGNAATVRNDNNLFPAYSVDGFYGISATSFTFLGSVAYNTASVATGKTLTTGRTRNLALSQGQSQNYSYSSASYTGTATTPYYSSAANETITFVVKEDVTSPAGVFKNACKFDVVRNTVSPAPGGISRFTVWYAPGWGAVKEESNLTFTDGRVPSTAVESSQVTRIVTGSL
jgi:hypothetical protein